MSEFVESSKKKLDEIGPQEEGDEIGALEEGDEVAMSKCYRFYRRKETKRTGDRTDRVRVRGSRRQRQWCLYQQHQVHY